MTPQSARLLQMYPTLPDSAVVPVEVAAAVKGSQAPPSAEITR
jgi:hypothetical protein